MNETLDRPTLSGMTPPASSAGTESQLPLWYRALVVVFFLHVVLAVLSLLFMTMFVLPQNGEKYQEWVKHLALSDPKAPEIMAEKPVFKAFLRLRPALSFLFEWWFVLIPGLLGLGIPGRILLRKLAPTTRLLIGGTGTLIVTVLVTLLWAFTGVFSAMLLANLKF